MSAHVPYQCYSATFITITSLSCNTTTSCIFLQITTVMSSKNLFCFLIMITNKITISASALRADNTKLSSRSRQHTNPLAYLAHQLIFVSRRVRILPEHYIRCLSIYLCACKNSKISGQSEVSYSQRFTIQRHLLKPNKNRSLSY